MPAHAAGKWLVLVAAAVAAGARVQRLDLGGEEIVAIELAEDGRRVDAQHARRAGAVAAAAGERPEDEVALEGGDGVAQDRARLGAVTRRGRFGEQRAVAVLQRQMVETEAAPAGVQD